MSPTPTPIISKMGFPISPPIEKSRYVKIFKHNNMPREEKIEHAKSLLKEEGYDVILIDKPLSDDQVWLVEFIQRLLEAKNMDERKALLEELENHKFNV